MTGLNEVSVIHIFQAVVVVNHEKLHIIISDKHLWCFSISFDKATNHGDCFIEFLVRVWAKAAVNNNHLQVIPVQGFHSS